MTKRAVYLLVATLGVGCSDKTSSSDPAASTDTADAATLDFDAGSGTHRASAALLRCAIGRREPTSIVDAITRINALAPADAPCIIASLPRPLSIVATVSRDSVQPADSAKSPRIFLILPKLTVSTVPSGNGSHVLEFGEHATSTQTIKGEIPLPVTTAIATDLPFTRVINQQGIATSCSSCHGHEHAASIPKAFSSDIVQPRAETVVTLEELSALHDECTQSNDPSDRCAVLHAVFDVGTVTQGTLLPDGG